MTPHASSPPTASDLGVAETTTNQLEAISRAVKEDPSRAANAKQLAVKAAQSRKPALVGVIKSNPEAAGRLILSQQDQRLIAGLGGAVEKPVTLSGIYFVKTVSQNGSDQELNILLSKGTEYELYSPGVFPKIAFGSTVTVTGSAFDKVIFVPSPKNARVGVTVTAMPTPPPKKVASGSSIELAGVTTAAATTTQTNVAVIPVNFSNSPSSLNLNNIKAAFNGNPGKDINSYWSENSYGTETLNPTFFGPYNLSVATGSGQSCPSGDWTQFYNQFGSTIDFTQYSRVVFIKNCTGGSFAGTLPVPPLPNGYIPAADISNLSSSPISQYTIIHELGHLAGSGNQHSNFYNCQPNAFTPPTRFGPNCSSVAYGSLFDIMGGENGESGGSIFPHMDAYHKANAGWLSAANMPTLNTPGTFTYKLLPYETPTSGVLALNIPRGNSGTALTLEYRQPIGFDSWMNSANASCTSKCQATAAPMLNFVYQSNTGDTQLIDTTPFSNLTSQPQDDQVDGMLAVGSTFTDPETNIQIQSVSADSTGATVKVTIPAAATCVRKAPTVALTSPASATVGPGQPAGFTYKVTSNDSAGCPAAMYRLTASSTMAYMGIYSDRFSQVFSPDVFNLAPGATVNIGEYLSSDAMAVDGNWQLTSPPQLVTDSLAVAPVSLPTVTYVVQTPADTTAPNVPTNLTATNLGSRGAKFSWDAASDNGSSGLAGYKVVVDGAYSYTTADTNFTVYTDFQPGNHSVTVQAFDHKGNNSAASTTVAFTDPSSSDNTPPGPPGGLTVTAGDHTITLNWGSSSDSNIIGYVITGFDHQYFVPAGTTSLTVGSLFTNTPFYLEVQAIDGNRNYSPDGGGTYVDDTIIATTGVEGTTAPTTPAAAYSPYSSGTFAVLAWQQVAGASGYNVYRNGTKLATTTSGSYADTKVVPGAQYKYQIQAYDSHGNVSPFATFEVPLELGFGTNDNNPPSGVQLLSPASGASLSGSISMTAAASDDTRVQAISYYLDNRPIGTASSSPYSVSWDSTQTFNGSHELEAVATDPSGNRASSGPISVTINNPPPK